MQCLKCNKSFTRRYTLNQHQLRDNCGSVRPQDIKCQKCNKTFTRRDNLKRHLQSDSCTLSILPQDIRCGKCKATFARGEYLKQHQERNTCDRKYGSVKRHASVSPPVSRKRLRPMGLDVVSSGVSKLTHAFKNRIAAYRFTSDATKIDFTEFFNDVKPKVLNILEEYRHQHTTLKINFEIFGIYIIPEKELSDIKSMNTANKIITLTSDLENIYEEFKQEIITQAADFSAEKSGWALQELLFLDVNINKFSAISASSFIPLPRPVERKNAVLNIRNDDNKCFAYCINAALFPADGDPEQAASYPPLDTVLDLDDMEFPVTLKDIPKFEKKNNISINVFGLEPCYQDGKTVYEIVGPLHYTSEHQRTHVNLLLISDPDGCTHYTLITDMSRLISGQVSKHAHRLYMCDGCLQSFPKAEQLQRHAEYDCTHVYSKLPTSDFKINKMGEYVPENILKFTNIEKQQKHPFVIYADFESLLKPIDHAEPSTEKSFSVKVCEHIPYSYAFYVKCSYDDSLSRYVMYDGIDVAKNFVQKLDQTVQEIYDNHLKNIVPMKGLSQDEYEQYTAATCCYLCQKRFHAFNHKVRDHCHLTGKFRGPAHNSCNLNYKVPKFIPIFFHNLTNYDSHLFIKELATNGERISAIAQTKEKYISFSKFLLVDKAADPTQKDTYIQLRFVDSYRFLARPLDKLSETLDSSQCIEVRKYFPNSTHFNLMRRKGVFPYSYVDSLQKLQQEGLPPKDCFYDKLRDESITDEEYGRAQTVWNTFGCQTLNDYARLYLQADVLLLADVFENFRKVCLENFHLDPANYLTVPSLSWDAMLRMTQVELQLLTDIDMVHFFKKGIRGGVAQCSQRKAVANNALVPNHDPSKPTSYILYVDATSLYGRAMDEPLPCGDFRWLTDTEMETFDVKSIASNATKGYVLEVDLEYPTKLHTAHNDLPFCPEAFTPPGSKHPKLIPNLHDKSKYIIHYRNLQQCMQYGLELKKIHRVLEFTQSQWLKQYIDLNTDLRNKARNEFERDLFKLLINAIFGKALENIERRSNIKLSSQFESRRGVPGARALISKPQFQSCSVFNENLVAIQLKPVKVYYDKPLYAGFAILDISKTIIYDFFYGYVKTLYKDAARLCYTDTDSLILEVFTDNVYEDMKQNIEYFDTSNYKVDNQHKMPVTVSIRGKMKDEFAGVPITAFYGTGAKAYCVQTNQLMKRAKGVSKHIIQNNLQLSDYVRIVENGGSILRKMYIFLSEFHTIYTELKNKVALSSRDDKRYVLPADGKTLAWGHLLITPQRHTGTLDDLIQAANECLHDTPTECPAASNTQTDTECSDDELDDDATLFANIDENDC